MASARIQAAIKTARNLLQGIENNDLTIDVIGSSDELPPPPENGGHWIIQYEGDAPESGREWRESLMFGED